MEASIRDARPADLRPLYQLLLGKATFDESLDKVRVNQEEFGLSLFGPNPPEHANVAELDSELVGFCTYFPIHLSYLGVCVWLDDLFVAEPHRGRGIGRRLLARVAHAARELGAARIEWTVATDNARGQSFYKQVGAELAQDARLVRLSTSAMAALAATSGPAA